VFTNGVRPKVSKTKSWNQLSLVLSKVAVMARLEKKRVKNIRLITSQVCLHFIQLESKQFIWIMRIKIIVQNQKVSQV
jgi:hypothetical protein